MLHQLVEALPKQPTRGWADRSRNDKETQDTGPEVLFAAVTLLVCKLPAQAWRFLRQRDV